MTRFCGRGALHKDIKPVDPHGQMGARSVGPALNLDTGPADILALLASLAFIQPGDLDVHAFSAHQNCASAGDSVSGMMKNCGASGFVTDGPIRDLDGVVVIPFKELGAVTKRGHEILNLETELDFKVRNGLTVPQNIKDLLASDQLEFVD